jgi:hypothetical protein
MKQAANQILAYGIWIVDFMVAFFLAFFIIKPDLLHILGLFLDPKAFETPSQLGFADKAFTLLLGLSWLAFMIFVEEYFKAGARKGNLLKRIARITGLLFLCTFVANLILFWFQGISSGSWLSWLILAVELIIGTGMYIYYKTPATPKTN